MKILVADDTQVTHTLLKLMIRFENHTIVSAYDGLEAIEFLKNDDFDLLITDIRMPGLDGLSLLAYVRNEEHYLNLPVIVMSASGQEQLQDESFVQGATAFLSQPFSSQDFRQLVAECLKSGKSYPADLHPAEHPAAVDHLQL